MTEMTYQVNLTSDELSRITENLKFSITKDALRLSQLNEEVQPYEYDSIKKRMNTNRLILEKIFEAKS